MAPTRGKTKGRQKQSEANIEEQEDGHKVPPEPTPVEVEGIPSHHIGDFLTVLEFLKLYAGTHDAMHEFNYLDIEILRRSLTEKERNGTFSNIVQKLLTVVFSLQERESVEVKLSNTIYRGRINIESTPGVVMARQQATEASKWSQTYLATPLRELPLDTLFVSEVLRLHLLSSGALEDDWCVRWRLDHRGDYRSIDDAGLQLRLAYPHIIRSLAYTHVADLPLDDKFRILRCLMKQILSYAPMRNMIAENWKKHRKIIQEFERMHMKDQKLESKLTAARIKLDKEAARCEGAGGPEGPSKLRKALDLLEQKKAKHEEKIKDLRAEFFRYQFYLGTDRAGRGYWLHASVPGVLVELPVDSAAGIPRWAVYHEVRQLEGLLSALDKSKPDELSLKNDLELLKEGIVKRMEECPIHMLSPQFSPAVQPSTSTGVEKLPSSSTTVPAGGVSVWENLENYLIKIFFKAEELIFFGNLGIQLNVKPVQPNTTIGAKELPPSSITVPDDDASFSEALDTSLRKTIHKTEELVFMGNLGLLKVKPVQPNTTIGAKELPPPPPSSIKVPANDASFSKALETSLRNLILKTEELVFLGNLGLLKVKDRDVWRGAIRHGSYDKQADYLAWGPNQQYHDDYHSPSGGIMAPEALSEYREPAAELQEAGLAAWVEKFAAHIYISDCAVSASSDRRINGTPTSLMNAEPPQEKLLPVVEPVVAVAEQQTVVRGLASALLQISQAIDHQYLDLPLVYHKQNLKYHDSRPTPPEFWALRNWEVSLMQCRSFAQVALHQYALAISVKWAAGYMNLSCKLCRLNRDGDNMMICDGCNKGHHIYCVTPKLTRAPEGSWYCEQCKAKKRFNVQGEPMVLAKDGRVCDGCASGGRLSAKCAACGSRFHAGCALSWPPRDRLSPWKCHVCIVIPTESSKDSTRPSNGDALGTDALGTDALGNDVLQQPLKNVRHAVGFCNLELPKVAEEFCCSRQFANSRSLHKHQREVRCNDRCSECNDNRQVNNLRESKAENDSSGKTSTSGERIILSNGSEKSEKDGTKVNIPHKKHSRNQNNQSNKMADAEINKDNHLTGDSSKHPNKEFNQSNNVDREKGTMGDYSEGLHKNNIHNNNNESNQNCESSRSVQAEGSKVKTIQNNPRVVDQSNSQLYESNLSTSADKQNITDKILPESCCRDQDSEFNQHKRTLKDKTIEKLSPEDHCRTSNYDCNEVNKSEKYQTKDPKRRREDFASDQKAKSRYALPAYERRSHVENYERVLQGGVLCACCLKPLSQKRSEYRQCDWKSKIAECLLLINPLPEELAQRENTEETFKLCSECHRELNKFATFEKTTAARMNYLGESPLKNVRHGVRFYDLSLLRLGKELKECARVVCLCCSRQYATVGSLRTHQERGPCKDGCSECKVKHDPFEKPSTSGSSEKHLNLPTQSDKSDKDTPNTKTAHDDHSRNQNNGLNPTSQVDKGVTKENLPGDSSKHPILIHSNVLLNPKTTVKASGNNSTNLYVTANREEMNPERPSSTLGGNNVLSGDEINPKFGIQDTKTSNSQINIENYSKTTKKLDIGKNNDKHNQNQSTSKAAIGQGCSGDSTMSLHESRSSNQTDDQCGQAITSTKKRKRKSSQSSNGSKKNRRT